MTERAIPLAELFPAHYAGRWTAPGFYVSADDDALTACVHCGAEESEHVDLGTYCPRPPLELVREMGAERGVA